MIDLEARYSVACWEDDGGYFSAALAEQCLACHGGGLHANGLTLFDSLRALLALYLGGWDSVSVLWEREEPVAGSRQRAWQLRQIARGNCQCCGQPRNRFAAECDACMAARGERRRRRYRRRQEVLEC